MPARKKTHQPNAINKNTSDALISEIRRIKGYALLMGWDLTNSYPIWDSETEFRLEFSAKKRKDVVYSPSVIMKSSASYKPKPKVKTKKKKFVFSMKGLK